jgi:protein-S-isoprenylcysteine O-methyltransferase Ste14
MPELIRKVAAQAAEPVLFVPGMALIYLTGLILLIAAAYKFLEHARHPEPLLRQRGHFFSTGEMVAGVVVLFPFWLNSIGQLRLPGALAFVYFGIGAAAVVASLAWHIAAKIAIRTMWSDGIEIKQAHQLVTRGAYALARHPMYASLLLWCWGAALMMANWASLLITSLVLLPLMIKRAGDEERELAKVQNDYLLYQHNTPMLTPRLEGAPALAVRIGAILLYGYSLYIGLTWSSVVLLVAVHLYLGFSLTPDKVAFSYRSKSAMTIVLWSLSLLWPPIHYLLYLVLAMFVYGLAFNCPCMLVYERYHGCPCFRWLKSCALPRGHGAE